MRSSSSSGSLGVILARLGSSWRGASEDKQGHGGRPTTRRLDVGNLDEAKPLPLASLSFGARPRPLTTSVTRPAQAASAPVRLPSVFVPLRNSRESEACAPPRGRPAQSG